MKRWLMCLGVLVLASACGGSAKKEGGAAGGGAVAGAGGMGTENTFATEIRQGTVDKLDLLFMIDNSVSMADKQEILKDALPVLLQRFIQPDCVSSSDLQNRTRPSGGICPPGFAPEFKAVDDIHIGVITSSLGAHGGDVCSDEQPPRNDKAHLLGSVRPGIKTWSDAGFLAWDPTGAKNTPPGESNATTLIVDFANLVIAAGELGCGYEASLEAWYRFLIEPSPPESVSLDPASGNIVTSGVDRILLEQREKFLRPDSVVGIVMLTDENDCSIKDEGLGWMVGKARTGAQAFLLWRSTSVCAVDSNDPCCRSCAANEPDGPPAGCAPLSADAECKRGVTPSQAKLSPGEDRLNLRCYDQKRRFGVDLLYPTERYVRGLTALTVPDRTQLDAAGKPQLVANPLFAGRNGKAPRDQGMVFLAGIVGVPWQDIADQKSLTDPNRLVFLNAEQLASEGRWDVILGDPGRQLKPTDPLMHEQYAPRTGTNPVTNAALASPNSVNPQANPINGHEYNIPEPSGSDGPDDLQYACIFPLKAPKTCKPGEQTCNCSPAENGDTSRVTSRNDPLCQPPSGGPAGTTQYFAKAYPGIRHLQVLKDLGENGIVASICPKVTTNKESASYGYNPAVTAIVDRLTDLLKGSCLPRALPVEKSSGVVACSVIEASTTPTCTCASEGRSVPSPTEAERVRQQLAISGVCGGTTAVSCDQICLCELKQHTGAELTTCQTNPNAAQLPDGFCYVDEALGAEQAAVVASCPVTQRRILRFTGKAPKAESRVFIACNSP